MPAPAPAITRLLALVHALSEYGLVLTRRINAADIASPNAALHVTGFNRVMRAVLWSIALAAIIRGEWRITLRPRRTPPSLSRPTPAPLHRARKPERRQPRVVPAAFTRLPIAQIAARICRDLGLTETSPLWPAGLMAIDQTPAEWATTHFPRPANPRRRRPTARLAAPAPPSRPLPARSSPPTPGILDWRPPPVFPSLRSQLLQTTYPPCVLRKSLAEHRILPSSASGAACGETPAVRLDRPFVLADQQRQRPTGAAGWRGGVASIVCPI